MQISVGNLTIKWQQWWWFGLVWFDGGFFGSECGQEQFHSSSILCTASRPCSQEMVYQEVRR